MATPNAVWVPSDANAWELAKWLGEDLSTGVVTVEMEGDKSQRTVNKAQTHPLDPSHLLDLDDLCVMNNLHEAPLLNMLKRHLLAQKIYTNTGDVLISLNPYKEIAGLYDNPLRFLDLPTNSLSSEPSTSAKDRSSGKFRPLSSSYKNLCAEAGKRPHVYAIANKALRSMMFRDQGMVTLTGKTIKVNQSVIVSGESGAGKTEASKYVMGFLIAANENLCASGKVIDTASTKGMGDAIKHVLLESSLVFEAFGNAKTVRNDNSSRFGKYIKLQYTADNRLVSAYTETFLLEKSRLVNLGQDERNYHIFYQLLRGIEAWDSSLATKLQLTSVDAFKILTEGHCTVVTNEADDARDFSLMCHALETLGCSREEMVQLWSLLACILHLGNVKTLADKGEDARISLISSSLSIEDISNILGLSSTMFQSTLTSQVVKVAKRSSIQTKMLSDKEVHGNIEALMKYLYKSLFASLVRKINNAHASADSEGHAIEKFIGILDIFGFEILRTNSFEQLCINFTNERLQQQFNEQIFVAEQEEYAREGLNWTTITFRDNQPVIDLISKKPMGLLYILEEHGMMNRKPDDGALLSSFNTSHDHANSVYHKSRFGNDSFVVKHFAGEVTYLIEGFIVKNNDSLQEDLMELLLTSSNKFFSEALKTSDLDLPTPPTSSTATSSNVPEGDKSHSKTRKLAASHTVSFTFRNQLDALTSALQDTEPHYIKCIKPNADKAPCTFSGPLVMEQLKYSGALEVVRIRREGFPTRMSFQSFYSDYEILCRGRGWKKAAECNEEEARRYAGMITGEVLKPTDFQVGHSLLFLSNDGLDIMENAVNLLLQRKAIVIQSLYRMRATRANFFRLKASILRIQCAARIVRSRKLLFSKKKAYEEELRKKREAELLRLEELRKLEEAERQRKQQIQWQKTIISIQAMARRRNARKSFLAIRSAIITIQSAERMRVKRLQFLDTRAYFTDLQAIIRRNLHRRKYATMKKGFVKLHKYARQFLRNRDLCNRVMELHTSCRDGNIEVFKIAVEAHPNDAFVRSKCGGTIYHSAMLGNHRAFVSFLDPQPWDIMERDIQGNTLLHNACSTRPDIDCIQLLCKVVNGFEPPATVYTATEDDDEEESDIVQSPTASPQASTPVGGTMSSPDANKGKPNSMAILQKGWLKRNRGGHVWFRRYCILTQDYILYYNKESPDFTKPQGIVPILGSTVKRVEGKEPIFEIFSPNMATKKNFFGFEKKKVMHFLTESEQECQEWLKYVKAWSGLETFRPADSVKWINSDLIEKWVSEKNKMLQTPLHTLCQFESQLSSEDVQGRQGEIDKAKVVAMWLIDNGCPIDGIDKNGYTPLHLAIEKGNFDIAVSLVKRGASISKKNIRGLSPLDIFDSSSKSKSSTSAIAELSALLRGPQPLYNKLRPSPLATSNLRYSYLSFSLKKLSRPASSSNCSLESMLSPHLQIQVFNSNKQMVEALQEVQEPLLRHNSFLYWGAMWHMTTPLENIESGSFIVIKLKSRLPDGQDHGEGWSYFTIDKETINSSTSVLLHIVPYPFQIDSAAKGSKLSSDGSSLEVDVSISRRGKFVEVKDMLTSKPSDYSPSWLPKESKKTPSLAARLSFSNSPHIPTLRESATSLAEAFGLTMKSPSHS